MGDIRRKGIVSQKTREVIGFSNSDKTINAIKEKIHEGNIGEKEFLNSFRLLKTYNERKEVLEKREYKLVGDDWRDKLPENDLPEFYYITFTINGTSKKENWIKRKSFELIKAILLKSKNISTYNPYSEFIVKDSDGNSHIFYKRD